MPPVVDPQVLGNVRLQHAEQSRLVLFGGLAGREPAGVIRVAAPRAVRAVVVRRGAECLDQPSRCDER